MPGKKSLMGVGVGKDKTAVADDAASLDMLAALGTPSVEPAKTPDAFLASVSMALKASDDVDADLAGILSDHLLTVTPNANAVANAKVAIAALAAKRAAQVEEHVDG